MWTTVRSLALLAVAVPATAYVVLETVVDESSTASRPVVVLEEANGTQQASAGGDAAGRLGSRDDGAGAGEDRPTSGSPGSTRTSDGTRCDDDGTTDDRDDDRDDEADDDVSVVRPCPTDVREDDPDDRDDVEDD